MTLTCLDCAATRADGATFRRKKRNQPAPTKCDDCAAIAVTPIALRPRPMQTRAAYRAAYRHRASLPQLDLVDLLVAPP
jgi:hypothetical protein